MMQETFLNGISDAEMREIVRGKLASAEGPMSHHASIRRGPRTEISYFKESLVNASEEFKSAVKVLEGIAAQKEGIDVFVDYSVLLLLSKHAYAHLCTHLPHEYFPPRADLCVYEGEQEYSLYISPQEDEKLLAFVKILEAL